MDEQLKKAHKKALGLERKMNEALKKINLVDTRKIVLTESPYPSKALPFLNNSFHWLLSPL
jgi:hypothetical protein